VTCCHVVAASGHGGCGLPAVVSRVVSSDTEVHGGRLDFDPATWITGDWWSYLIIGVVITGSAVFPPLPSEGMLVTATGLALASRLDPLLVAVAAGSGALCGDLLAYSVGVVAVGRAGSRPPRRVRRAVEWLRRRQEQWLPALIVAGRFVPGGTTTVGLASGALRYPFPRFVTLAAVGVVIWVGYGFGIAAVGRAASPGSPWLSVLIGLGIVAVLTAVLHGVRRLRRGRARDRAHGDA
jgi:membrane-associated protein